MNFLSRTFTQSVQNVTDSPRRIALFRAAKAGAFAYAGLSQSIPPDGLGAKFRPLKTALPSEPIPSAAKSHRVISGAAVQQWQTSNN